ncbi:MAG: VWA domain-containing protein [Chthonomonadaceae bacterium]|nr:VWA domain-containing protein [Chthonomonadaceae bacterium]
MARPRKRLAFVVRSVLCACLVLAMSGPQIHRINSGTATMFIIDGSDSVSESDHKEAEQYISRAMLALGPEDVAGVVSFGAQPVLDSVPAGRRPFTGVQSKLDRSASDLAAAIRLASATLPTNKGRRIVVLSDGNETRGDVRQSAEASLNEGIELDIVPLGSKPRQAEASVIEMRAPNESRAGQPFGVRVVLESTVQQEATIIVDRNGTVVSRQRVQLDEGKTSYVLDQKLDGPGYYRFRATLQAQRDSDSRNNVGSTFTAVRGKPKVLVLQSDRVPGPLVLALRSQDITVDVFGPEGVPVRPEELQNYEAVFLNDINAQFVTPNQMKILAAAARDTGIGLVMVGGENSYLPGGWYGTPVADALPVDLNIRQRKSYPSTSVLVIADASGSMGMIEDGLQKIQLAAKAAEETVKLMSPIDRVGVAGSSDGIEFVAPLQDLKDKDSVISQIRKLRTGGGGIYSSPSIHFADSKLRAENSKVRHLVLLADGADVDDYGDSINVVSRMKADKITTSVVAIGDGKDVPFLRALAAAGGGNFYLANKASKLPAIFTQDVAIMSRSAIEELVFVPEMKGGEEALRGFSPSDFPALSAYCLADSRPLARVGLVSPKKDPVLASWQYGLATTVAFMSDAQPRWASRWVGWGGFPVFWAQVARTVTRKATNNDYRLVVEPSGGQAVLKLTAMDRFLLAKSAEPKSSKRVSATIS